MFGSWALGLALALSACGGGEREFTASELIDELNDKGAPLELEGTLASAQEGLETFELAITEPGAADAAQGHDEGGATLILTENAGDAPAEFERCESALSLTCFRVANGVIALTDDNPSVLAKVGAAVSALESDGD